MKQCELECERDFCDAFTVRAVHQSGVTKPLGVLNLNEKPLSGLLHDFV